MKAQKIVTSALEVAIENNEMEQFHILVDSVKYSKKLKLQIIDEAKKLGISLKLDDSKLFNKRTKRLFTCNNIIKA